MRKVISFSSRVNYLVWLPLLLAIIGYTIFFTYLSILKYQSFFSFTPDDLAINNNILWHTSRGNLFYQSITETLFDARVQPFYLFIAVIYKVYSHIFTLFALEHLALAFGALPVFLISRQKFNSRLIALLFGLSYLLYNPLHHISFVDQKPLISFAITFFLFSFYFLEKKRFAPFMVFSLLGLTCRDEVSFFMCMFGAYAFLKGMRLRWKAAPVIIGIVYFALTWYLIMPALNYRAYNNPYVWNFFRENPNNYSFIQLIFHNFGDVARRLFTSDHAGPLIKLFISPFSVFSVIAPEVLLIGLPTMFAVQLSADKYFVSLESMHHLAFLVPVIFLASLFGMYRTVNLLYRWKIIPQRFSVRKLFQMIALVFFIFQFSTNFGRNILLSPGGPFRDLDIADRRFMEEKSMYSPIFYKQDQKDRAAWEFIDLIPDSASVSTTDTYLPALSSRGRIYHFGTERKINDRYGHNLEVDYVFLNKDNDYLGFGGRELRHEMIIEKIPLLLAGGYAVIKEDKNFILFKRMLNE